MMYPCSLFLFKFLFSLGEELTYNVVLVSGVQQRDSVTHVHVSLLSQIPLPLGYCRMLSRVPCAMQLVLVICSIYSRVYIGLPWRLNW